MLVWRRRSSYTATCCGTPLNRDRCTPTRARISPHSPSMPSRALRRDIRRDIRRSCGRRPCPPRHASLLPFPRGTRTASTWRTASTCQMRRDAAAQCAPLPPRLGRRLPVYMQTPRQMGAPVLSARPLSTCLACWHLPPSSQPVIALVGLHYLASTCTLLNDTSIVPRNGCVGSLSGLLLALLLAAAAANAALKSESGGEAGRRLVHASSD